MYTSRVFNGVRIVCVDTRLVTCRSLFFFNRLTLLTLFFFSFLSIFNNKLFVGIYQLKILMIIFFFEKYKIISKSVMVIIIKMYLLATKK